CRSSRLYLGLELRPPRVQSIDLGARRLEVRVPGLERGGIRGDRLILRGPPARLERGLRLEDRRLHPVPLPLLQVSAPPPLLRLAPAGHRPREGRGGEPARGDRPIPPRALPLGIVRERLGFPLPVERHDDGGD